MTNIFSTNSLSADRALNYVFVLYAFVLPLSRAGVGIATVLIVVLFFFTKDIKLSMRKIWINRASSTIVLFILFYFLTLIRVPADQIKEGFIYLLPFLYLLPALIAFVTLEKKSISMVVLALILGIFVSEIISYGIFFGFWEKKNVLIIDPSPFMHHIQYSTFLAFGIIIALYKMLHQSIWSHKILYGIFVLSSIGTLFLIKGRTGQITFLVGLFVLVFLSFQNKLKAILVSLLISMSILFLAYQISDTFKERITMAQSDLHNMIDKQNYGTSLGYRTGVTILSARLIERYPLFGTGVVDAMPFIQKEAKIVFPDDYWLNRANHLQNQYLQVLVESGIVGLFFLLLMIYQIARIPIVSDEYKTMKITLIVIYILTMMSDVQLHIQFTAGLFAIIVGILLAQSRIEEQSHA